MQIEFPEEVVGIEVYCWETFVISKSSLAASSIFFSLIAISKKRKGKPQKPIGGGLPLLSSGF